MKTKLFIVTYNASDMLNATLHSLYSSDFDQSQEVIILNNHSNFSMEETFQDKVKVIHNQGRPDFSKGHLSRSWNQALLHGFKDLSSPDADLVVAVQDDTEFTKDWYARLQEYSKTYTFITSGAGDNFCSYTAEAVRNIGIWDERFCNIGFQEGDYFLRAYLYNRGKSSINDEVHHRIWNPLPQLVNRPYSGFVERSHNSFPYHKISLQVFERKWPVTAAFWDHPNFFSRANQIVEPLIPTYVTYPYFEKDIYNLRGKGYFATF